VDSTLFLHLYHIEKFNTTTSIWKEALKYTNTVFADIKTQNPKICIDGISAYCTTSAGVYLTTGVWQLQELGYKSDEYVVSTNNEQKLTKLLPHEIQYYLDNHYTVQKCMFVSADKEMPSVIWNFIK